MSAHDDGFRRNGVRAVVAAAIVMLSLAQTFVYNATALADDGGTESYQQQRPEQVMDDDAAIRPNDTENTNDNDAANAEVDNQTDAGADDNASTEDGDASGTSAEGANTATTDPSTNGSVNLQQNQNAQGAEDSRDNDASAERADAGDASGSGTDDATSSGSRSAAEQWYGWKTVNGVLRWYDHGASGPDDFARSKEVYDRTDGAWYRLDDSGSKIVNRDYPDTKHHRWLRYDANGRMVKGIDYRYGHWYSFDLVTGAMLKGMHLIADGKGRRWVYYDVVTGQMAFGERRLNYDKAHTGWYYFNPQTGGVTYGWVHLPGKWVYYGKPDGKMRKGAQRINGASYYFNLTTGAITYGWKTVGGKRVFYDRATGKMVHGSKMIDGRPYYFDQRDGHRYSRRELINRLLGVVRSTYGKNIDAPGVLAANGGLLCPYGPCMAWVWWCFNKAGMSIFLSGGATSGWPHHNFDWYRSRGRVNMTPKVGDLAFYKWSDQPWAKNLSAAHVGIVVAVKGKRVTIADAAFTSIAERPSYTVALQGYAEPYWD
ncbi:Surface protective antigen SpaA [Bifidobacterium ramosum]|nr:CHAP domain-containing protein [Bifidobacterium ramosum]KAB8288600.1 Surface protective antigen SpaA [Bifidobacterium ramosum]